MARYVANSVDLPQKLSTTRRHLAAIHKHHQLCGYPSWVRAKELVLVMEGITRTLGKRQKLAPALTVEGIKENLRQLDITTIACLHD